MKIDELIKKAAGLIENRDRAGIRAHFRNIEPADAAEVFRSFLSRERLFLLSSLTVEYAADLFQELTEEEQEGLVGEMEEGRLGALLDELDPDERADLLANIPEDIRDHFLSLMDREEAEDARRLISYAPDTAGGRMTTDYARVRPEMTVGEAMELLRSEAREVESIYYIYVVDEGGLLKGMVSFKYLVFAGSDDRIEDIMLRDIISVPADMDQEQAARQYGARYDLLALPVVGRGGEMLGIITYDDMMEVLREENTEDMHRFGAAGMEEPYMSSPVLTIARQRFVWLFVLVVASFLSVMLMGSYSGILGKVIALAFFIPLLMNSAGNAGTQAATVAVRGLATGELRLSDFWRVAKKELLIGAAVGGALGVLGLVRAYLLNKSPALGLTVGITLTAAVAVSTIIGGILPFVFKRLGFDPALMSGPLLTTIMDSTTLLIYFGLAQLIFGIL